MRAPAILLAIPLTIGCASGLLLCAGKSETWLAPFATTAAAAALLALLGGVSTLAAHTPRSADDASERAAATDCTVCLVLGALLVGLSCGAGAALRAYRSPLFVWFKARQPGTGPVVLYGVLREDAAPTQSGISLSLDVRAVECADAAVAIGDREGPCATRGGVRLSVAGNLAAAAMAEWRAGRVIRVAATLREPTTYRNPGVPDEQRALARRGIALVGAVKSGAMVEVLARGSRLAEWTSAFRVWVRSVLATTVGPWSARSAGVATAIAIGDRTGLAQEDEERLQAAGTYHVIAISGGNIAILTVLILGIGRTLGASPRTCAAVAIVVLLAYGEVTAPAPSVDRAIAAAVLFLSGRLLEQRGPSMNVLAVAATLGLAASPVAVFDPGFILSFGATLGILIGVPRLTRAFVSSGRPASGHDLRAGTARARRRPRSWRSAVILRLAARQLAAAVVTVLAATVAAEVVLAPMSAALFGRITCAGLLLNLAAIPLMTVVQVGSLATLGAWLVDVDLARTLGFIVHLAARSLVDSARLVDFAPWLSRELAPPAWTVLSAYYGSLVVAVLRGRAALVASIVATLVGVLIVIGPHRATRDAVPLPPRGVLRCVFLDVGQGDATLLIMPDRRAFLVDAGGLPTAPLQDPTDGPAFDIGDRVVARALRAFGVRSLDTFVLTHADPDHIGGARSIVRSFTPRAVWEGVPVPPHDPLRWLADAADRVAAEWRTVQSGDHLRIADVDIRALHPPLPEWERQRVRNDDSIVLAVTLGGVSVILPGDIGREGETLLRGHLAPSAITVLKAPHHGSATSSTRDFLEAVRPAAVIVSAGRANRFGHPAPAVVARYRAMGIPIFSTAEDGAVVLDTDGTKVEIRTWSERALTLARSANANATPHHR